jgi:hypothetical protein
MFGCDLTERRRRRQRTLRRWRWRWIRTGWATRTRIGDEDKAGVDVFAPVLVPVFAPAFTKEGRKRGPTDGRLPERGERWKWRWS